MSGGFDNSRLVDGIKADWISQVTPRGLILKSGLAEEDWSRVAVQLAQNARLLIAPNETLCACLGDVLNYQENRYHGQIAELARAAGYSPGTLRNSKQVCGRLHLSRRRDELSWSHHIEAGSAFTNETEIVKWLQVAIEDKLSAKALRQRIRVFKSGRSPNPVMRQSEDIADFELLREVRAADRQLTSKVKVWQRWSPQKCNVVRRELETLSRFIHHLETNSGDIRR